MHTEPTYTESAPTATFAEDDRPERETRRSIVEALGDLDEALERLRITGDGLSVALVPVLRSSDSVAAVPEHGAADESPDSLVLFRIDVARNAVGAQTERLLDLTSRLDTGSDQF